MDFRTELEALINRYSMENGSNTPDYILAAYLNGCLENFDKAVKLRDMHEGREVRHATVTLDPKGTFFDRMEQHKDGDIARMGGVSDSQ